LSTTIERGSNPLATDNIRQKTENKLTKDVAAGCGSFECCIGRCRQSTFFGVDISDHDVGKVDREKIISVGVAIKLVVIERTILQSHAGNNNCSAMSTIETKKEIPDVIPGEFSIVYLPQGETPTFKKVICCLGIHGTGAKARVRK
jgi:hypothetical protein